MFALTLSEDRASKYQRRIDIMEGLAKISDQFKEILKLDQSIKEMCLKFKDQKSLLLLGRGSQHATALEGKINFPQGRSQKQRLTFIQVPSRSRKSPTSTARPSCLAS